MARKPGSWDAFNHFEPSSFTEADSNILKIGSVIPTEWAGPPSLKLF
jgi:hypothetical protein